MLSESRHAPHRPVSAAQCYVAYGSAVLAGFIAWTLFQRLEIISQPLILGLAVSLIATCVIWISSISNGNSSIYDPYWVIAPPLLALGMKTAGGGLVGAWNTRQILVLTCLILWSARYHIFYRWSGWRNGLVQEDWRYEDMRHLPIPYWINSLIGMHIFPTLLVYAAFIPAAMIMGRNPVGQRSPGFWDLIALIGALTAIVLELVADEQLRRYRESPEYQPEKTFRQGLWNWSRHPNYFGEVLFWLSMIPFAVGAGFLAQTPLLIVGGGIVMALFFRFSSYLMDRRSLRFRDDYRQVMREISVMIPWPPRSVKQAKIKPGKNKNIRGSAGP